MALLGHMHCFLRSNEAVLLTSPLHSTTITANGRKVLETSAESEADAEHTVSMKWTTLVIVVLTAAPNIPSPACIP